MDPLTEDTTHEVQPKNKVPIVALAVVSGAAVLSLFIFAPGPRDFLRAGWSIFSQSLSDTFSSRKFGKFAAEIDLQAENAGVGGLLSIDGKNSLSGRENQVVSRGQSGNSGRSQSKEKNNSSGGGLQGEAAANSSGNSAEADAESDLGTLSLPNSSPENVSSADRGCAFSAGNNFGRDISFNEIAWMGSVARAGESGTAAANNEWIELKNNSVRRIDLSGWSISAASGKFKIDFEPGDAIGSNSFYLLERADDNSVPAVTADKIYSGSLTNSGMRLGIFSDECFAVDEIDASLGWPAGENESKQTLERNLNDFGWHTSANQGGTPRAQNSSPAPASQPASAPTSSNSGAAQTSSPSPTSTSNNFSQARFNISVSMQGEGSGIVSSNPAGIQCGFDCSEEYAGGTAIVFTATPAADSVFDGWSGSTGSPQAGPCSGKGNCSFSVTAHVPVIAVFKLINGSQPAVPSPQSSGGSPPGVSGEGHLVIAEVQIAGASTTNDFIKIYNPGNSSVDISGWKLRKRTASGNDSSIREFLSGSIVVVHGYFTWANSDNGFNSTVGADTTTGSIISPNNSIALLSFDDAVVDAVAWGSGHANPYVEGAAYPANPEANKILGRKFTGGELQDTNDNSADFEIK